MAHLNPSSSLLYPFPFFSQHLFVEEEEEKQNVPLNPA
jgi:hypothetical protein